MSIAENAILQKMLTQKKDLIGVGKILEIANPSIYFIKVNAQNITRTLKLIKD